MKQMPSQFIFWPVTLPEEIPMSPKPDPSLNAMHPLPPPPQPRPRSRKSAKQAAPKRPPQRGLGVAQLERLRMEQAGETELLMHNQPPRQVVLPQMFVGPYPPQAGPGGGVVPGPYPVGSMGPPAGYMTRYLAAPAPEPPSTQMVPRPLMSPPVEPVPCYSDQCEFCVRKRRLFGENPVYENLDGANHLEMNLTATMTPTVDLDGGFMASMDRKVSTEERRRQTREYQFFPTYGGSLAEVAFNQTMDDAFMLAPLASSFPSQPIDLSLKL